MSASKSLLDLSPRVFRDLCDNLDGSAVRGWQDLLANVAVVKYTPLQSHRFSKTPSPAEEVLIDLSKVGVNVDDLYRLFCDMEHKACMEILREYVSPEVAEEERLRMERRNTSKTGAPPSNEGQFTVHPLHGPLPSDPPPISSPYPSNHKPTNREAASTSGSEFDSSLTLQDSSSDTYRSWNGTETSSSQNGTRTGQSLAYYSGSSQGASNYPQANFVPQLPPSMMSSKYLPSDWSTGSSSYVTTAPSSAHNHAPYQTNQPHSDNYRHMDPGSSIDSYAPLLPNQHPQQYWDTPTSGVPRDAATPNSLNSTSLSSYMSTSVVSPSEPSVVGVALPNILSYTYEELSQSTGGFTQNIVGIGSFGTVYYAMIRGNGPYAIKKLHNESEMGEGGFYEPFHQESFLQELQLLTKYNHTNILSLVAYSNDGIRPCLVYEYMKNGSLADCLLGKRNIELPWKLRMTIANQIADAIHFLHSANKPKLVVHGDIKSANILLDGNLVAKLSDFGLARETQRKTHQRTTTSTTSTLLKGTIPYMAPEFIRNGKLTVKTDVYSFGVVLLELYSGQAPGQSGGEQDSVGRKGVLTERLSPYIANSDHYHHEIVALGDRRADWPEDIGTLLFNIATVCLTPRHTKRPEMDQVRDQLRE